MRMIRNLIAALMIMSVAVGCTTSAVTGRKQLKLVDEKKIVDNFAVEYSKLIADATSKGIIVNSSSTGKLVKKTGAKISIAVIKYLNENGMSDRIPLFAWEFNTVKESEVNAWCGPGGKILFYSGISTIASDENGIAAVMAHEISHAVAGHSAEGASNATAANAIMIGKQVADILTGGKTAVISNDVLAQGLGLGLLKYNRTQEYEADKLGMIFMAMAGYNPEEAIKMQERLAEVADGNKVPEYLSTHPAAANRIEKLKEYLPEAMKYYTKK